MDYYYYFFLYSAKQKLHEHTLNTWTKTQTRKRQNSTTHISPDLRKAHSDIARGLNLENKNKEIILDY